MNKFLAKLGCGDNAPEMIDTYGLEPQKLVGSKSGLLSQNYR